MEYPVYPEYKYSDIHWLEKIPTHWEVRRVKLLANETLQYGANEAALLDDKNMPRFIRITDVKTDGNLHENTFRSLPENIAEPFLLKEGDILLARSGATVGKSFKYSDSWGRAAYAGYLIRFRVNKEILIDSYAYAYFKSSVFWANINSTLIQSTIQNFSAEKYANIKIPFPDIQEQQKIADFLDYKTQQIDQLIEKKKALIEKLNEQRIAVITQAVTKGIDKNAKMKPSGVDWLGDVPEHWSIRRLKFLSNENLQYGANESAEMDDRDSPRFIRITDVKHDGTLRDDTFRSLPEEIAEPFLLSTGDVLLARSGATVGKSFIYSDTWGRAAYAGYLIRFRANMEIINANFAYYYFQTSIFWANINSTLIQSTIQNFSAEKYANILLPVPPIAEQLEINTYLNKVLKKLDGMELKAKNVIEKLEEYRSSLITAAVTGKIDIRNIELPSKEAAK
jgi:restriction endonuclease S subunit